MKKELVKLLDNAAVNYVSKKASTVIFGEVKIPECLKEQVEGKMNKKDL